jgi:hypothetical protein
MSVSSYLLKSIEIFSHTICLNQDLNKVKTLCLIDMYIVSFFCKTYPPPLPPSSLSLQVVCWRNEVICATVSHCMDLADCVPVMSFNMILCLLYFLYVGNWM